MADDSLYDPELWRKLEERAIPEPNSGCLLWLHAVNQDGYGIYKAGDGLTDKAHRLALIAKIGPIPDNVQACHRCDVPSCIAPAHLFPGTHAENMLDRNRKGRARGASHAGSKNPIAKLSEADVRAIRQAAGTQRAIAKRFGVHFGTVNDILLGKTWRHIR
jgi:hypothetical protein